MDVLVLENMILYKEEQPIFEDNIDWKSQFELDQRGAVMDKNQSEKKKLYDWACANSKELKNNFFTLIDKNMESYFNKVKQTSYIDEYNVCNAEDIKKQILNLVQEREEYSDLEKVLLVACLKNRPDTERLGSVDNTQEEIPSFIYNFQSER